MTKNVYSVTQVNTYLKNMISRDYLMRGLSVRGEISNVKYYTNGYIYFDLKDENSILPAMMFPNDSCSGLHFRLENGMQVVVLGLIDVYVKSGKYQLYAKAIEPEGKGELYLAFEETKRRLEETGYFAPEYKKEIPRFCQRIGVVTSDTGAVIHDIETTAKRRYPFVEIYLCPAKVQGADAEFSIIRGIEILDRMGLDCIIIGRGGGSMEDLWAFNKETLAKAIFDADTPIISAVGHETDYTIADFVADVRAATPTAAAELAVFRMDELVNHLSRIENTMRQMVSYRVLADRNRLNDYRLAIERFSPSSKAVRYQGKIDGSRQELVYAMEQKMRDTRSQVAGLQDELYDLLVRKAEYCKRRFDTLRLKLEAKSPMNYLDAGYGYLVTLPKEGNSSVIRSGDQVDVDDSIGIYIRDTYLEAKITRKEEIVYAGTEETE